MIRSPFTCLVALASGALAFVRAPRPRRPTPTPHRSRSPTTPRSLGLPPPLPSPGTLLAGRVTVKLIGLTRTPTRDDLDILLVSPQGVKLLLMSDGGARPTCRTSRSRSTTPRRTPCRQRVPHQQRDPPPTRNVGGDSIRPAPAGLPFTSLSNVRGMDANGVWSRCTSSTTTAGTPGSLSGWSITVTPSVCADQHEQLGRRLAAAGDPRREWQHQTRLHLLQTSPGCRLARHLADHRTAGPSTRDRHRRLPATGSGLRRLTPRRSKIVLIRPERRATA